jgi:hypothetical protein
MPPAAAVSSPTQQFHCGRIAHELSVTTLMNQDKNLKVFPKYDAK